MPLTFGDAYAKSVGALGLFTVNARLANTRWANRVTKTYTRCDLAIREGLIASLHFVVAVGLITGGIVLVVWRVYFWLFLVIFGYFRMDNSTDVVFSSQRRRVFHREHSAGI